MRFFGAEGIAPQNDTVPHMFACRRQNALSEIRAGILLRFLISDHCYRITDICYPLSSVSTSPRTKTRGTMASPYRIQIPIFEGPLDLLLDLIKKQEMNIHDIQISKITSQYLDYLHQLETLNIDVSAEFIYMAATLIYIKSKMLLPPDPLATPEEQGADPREELVQRLLEHEKFKNAAQLLYERQQIEENVWSKPDKSLYNDESTEGELVVSLVDLVRVFQQVLERKKEVTRIELQHETFTVAQMIAQLRGQILASENNTVSLIQFFEACPSRHAMIVAFLAVLEMVKLQAIALIQEKQFGEIWIKRAKAFDVAFDDSGALRIDAEYQ
jgi:segregation and condensation protein A